MRITNEWSWIEIHCSGIGARTAKCTWQSYKVSAHTLQLIINMYGALMGHDARDSWQLSRTMNRQTYKPQFNNKRAARRVGNCAYSTRGTNVLGSVSLASTRVQCRYGRLTAIAIMAIMAIVCNEFRVRQIIENITFSVHEFTNWLMDCWLCW